MTLNELVAKCHMGSDKAGWYLDPESGKHLSNFAPYDVVVKIALIHSEVSEALEAHRRQTMDDKLPQFTGIETELADVIIRVLDLCGYLGIDIENVIQQKMAYNDVRPDHKIENRAKKGGKRY